MEKSLYDDSCLLRTIQGGDRKAFDFLFRKYYPILCSYACRFLTQEDAEEEVQDILLWLWENRDRPGIDYSLKHYLFRMTHHRCLNRNLQNEAKLRRDTVYYERMLETLQEVDVMQVYELGKHIRESIGDLPESYREAFLMHRFQQLSHKEIAAKLNVSHQTVNYRIGQAVKLLRSKLKDYLPLLLSCLFHWRG